MLLPRDRGVALELGVDERVVGDPGLGQPRHQRPAQVGVDVEAVDRGRPVEQALHLGDRLVGDEGTGVGAGQDQLGVAARLRGVQEVTQPASQSRRSASRRAGSE